jgi:long-chain acyl-CoA synthetase
MPTQLARDVQVPETFAGSAALGRRRFGSAPATVARGTDGTWQTTTYEETGAAAEEFAAGLLALGVRRGDRVAVLGAIGPDWLGCLLGIAAAGAVLVPVLPTTVPDEVAHVLGDCGAVVAVCLDPGQLAKLQAVRNRLPDLRVVIASFPRADVRTLTDVRANGVGQELTGRTAEVQADDLLAILYTSGTTGPKKGCALSHRNYKLIVDALTRSELNGGPGTMYLYLIPHGQALLMQLLMWTCGCSMTFASVPEPERVLAEVREVRPDYLPLAPLLLERAYTEVRGKAPEDVRAVFGGRLRHLPVGGASVAPEIVEFFTGCGVPVLESYGLTEAATTVTMTYPDNVRPGTLGRPLPGIELRTASDGELLIRGENVFRGYWNQHDGDFGAVVDGWLHTGDLGHLDAEGHLVLTGRRKEIINPSHAHPISPVPLESALRAEPLVSQAVLHGENRPYPVLLLTLDPVVAAEWSDTGALRAELARAVERANARVPEQARARDFWVLDRDLTVADGELTETFKVRRDVVEKRYADRFAALYPLAHRG